MDPVLAIMNSQAENEALKAMAEVRKELIITPKLALFAGIVFYLDFKVDWGCQIAWTDGKSLAVNPEHFIRQTPPMKKTIIIHEIAHCFLLHPWRMKPGMDMQLCNTAADYAINLLIKDELHLPLEEGMLYDPSFRGMSMEEIYRRLRDKQINDQPQTSSQPQDEEEKGQSDDPEVQDEGQGQTNENDEGDSQKEDGAGDDGDSSQGDGGESQSESSGNDSKGNSPDDSTPQVEGPAALGEIRPAPGDTQERSEQEQDMRRHIQQAIDRASKTMGSEMGDFADNVRKELETKLNWKEVLARYIMDSSPTDYSWSRPSRRHSGDMAMPSLYEQKVTGITIAIDTSGSMSDGCIDQCWSEVQGILQQMTDDYEVTILWFDTSVYPQVLEPGDVPIKTGRGGTFFELPFEWIANTDHETKLLIFLTDGEGIVPAAIPDYEVLWILTQECNYFNQQKPFGEVVIMD